MPYCNEPRILQLPVYVISVGHYIMSKAYSECAIDDPYVQIFWGVKNYGDLFIGGKSYRLSPGTVVWKTSEEKHEYHSFSDNWELRWIVIDGELADAFISGYNYPKHILHAGDCPVDLFTEIETGLKRMTPFDQRHALSVAIEILARAGQQSDGTNEPDRVSKRFIELAYQHYEDPMADVNSIAGMMGIHRTTLRRHFDATMHTPPSEYLKRLRVQRAVVMLKSTRLPIAEIAVKVGLPNSSHFSRAVKSITDKTPHEVRKEEFL